MILKFCTLFDSNYAAKGWVMYQSLRKVCSQFHLYVFAFDESLANTLKRMRLPDITVIPLSDFEDEDLLRVKAERSTGEYCWTCSSSTILYCIQHYHLDHCTYLDSDLYFFSDPDVLIKEMGEADVLITEHRYSSQYDQSDISGKYCVQFMTFKNTDNSLAILRWWRNECLKWCYNRHEDGRFGDQKYLDDWTTRFNGVHVLNHLGGGVAPWNMQQYVFFQEKGQLKGRDTRGLSFDVVFFHFHALLCFKKGLVREFYAQEYELSRNARKMLYVPYISHLKRAFYFMSERIREADCVATQPNPIPTWWKYLKRIRKRLIQKETRYFYWIGK